MQCLISQIVVCNIHGFHRNTSKFQKLLYVVMATNARSSDLIFQVSFLVIQSLKCFKIHLESSLLKTLGVSESWYFQKILE